MVRGAFVIPDQQALWNKQHATRGAMIEGGDLRFSPNQSAIDLAKRLNPQSVVVEAGCANGRDARYLAREGHTVFALDFSETALEQLGSLAHEEGVTDRITPILWDANTGYLPIAETIRPIDAFYARSSLHVGDDTLFDLAWAVDARLANGGMILIEGKGPNDEKIARSEYVGRNIVIDPLEGGHLRRVWTCEFARKLCDTLKWDILELADRREMWNGTPATFMRLLARKGEII